MKQEEFNRVRFGLQQQNRNICKRMLSTIDPSAKITEDKAAEIMDQAAMDLKRIREEHRSLWKMNQISRDFQEIEEINLAFSNVLKDSIEQAISMSERQSNPIRFHIYH